MRKSTTADHEPVPDAVADLIRLENPNRFLDGCSPSGLTPTLASILRGMRDPERAYAYVYCECHCQGRREAVLGPLVECYWATRDRDVPGGTPASEADDVGADREGPDRDNDTRDRSDTDEEVSDREFEERVAEALGVARTMAQAEVRERLAEETDREQPRKHVVAALNRRLEDFEKENDDERDQADRGAGDGHSDRGRDDRPEEVLA